MQLFITSPDPKACAVALDDKHVNNQIRETAQLLCTAFRVNGLHHPGLMRKTHENHPVSKWVRASFANWAWTYKHFEALAQEKLVRWPDNGQHKNWLELNQLLLDLGPSDIFSGSGSTPFANCAKRDDLGIDFTHIPDVHQAYRLYTNARWSLEQPRWSNRPEPEFYVSCIPA